jgi:hypothetical protein
MTAYTNRISFLAPVEHAAACNRAANALGRSGPNFSIRLSATGAEPATHLGGSTVETDLFLAAVAVSPELPAGLDAPPDLEPADWQAVADYLTVISGPSASTRPPDQFAELLAAQGLQRIETDE